LVTSVNDPPRRYFYVTTMAFSPDGKALVVGFNDGQAHVWGLTSLWARAAAPKRPVAKVKHDAKAAKDELALIWAIAFTPDGRSFATGSGHGTIKVWDAVKGK
jgi:WD40 repeat protein